MGESSNKSGTGLQPNVAGLLCYVLGWVTGIIFLILENKNEYVRFHAIQSIVAFGAITVVYMVIGIIFFFVPILASILYSILGIITFILWIVLMVKAYQGQRYKLLIAGDIAEQNSKPKS